MHGVFGHIRSRLQNDPPRAGDPLVVVRSRPGQTGQASVPGGTGTVSREGCFEAAWHPLISRLFKELGRNPKHVGSRIWNLP